MPKWTYTITILNNTGRALELVSSNLVWGKKSKDFPNSIPAGEKGEFSVYSPAGTSTGIELYFSMCDKPNESGKSNYGTFSFSLDIPYWKHKNTSSLTCTGMLIDSGFEKIPDGAHDFATTVTISTTLNQNTLSDEDALGYNRLYDWSAVKPLDVVDPNDVTVDSILPDSNILGTRKTVCRTEQNSIPKDLWSQIKDKKYPEIYNKKDYVDDYFTVMIYERRANKAISLAANQSYDKTMEITNTSSVRRETEESLRIENVIGATGGPEKVSLSETLTIQYEIHNIHEYCEEKMESVREEFMYEAVDYDRSIVLWDVVRVLALYRKDKSGVIEMIGVDDYYMTAAKKTYTGNDISNLNFECANSQENFESEEIILTLISGNVTINNTSYKWKEVSFGTNRGIVFNPGQHRYRFNPNPHGDRQYNNDPPRWYNQIVNQIVNQGTAARWTPNNWPHRINNLIVNGNNYTAL